MVAFGLRTGLQLGGGVHRDGPAGDGRGRLVGGGGVHHEQPDGGVVQAVPQIVAPEPGGERHRAGPQLLHRQVQACQWLTTTQQQADAFPGRAPAPAMARASWLVRDSTRRSAGRRPVPPTAIRSG